LRRYRVAAGLSQETLAERSGLSVRGISDLERGARRFPRLETVRMLADALHLTELERTALLAAARPELDGDVPEPVRLAKTDRPLTLRPLPIPPTRSIGRDAEIERITALFRTGATRLITLTGQGGIGKSRLGLSIARALSSELAGRVAFLELASVRDALLVPGALASQLGVAIDTVGAVPDAIALAIGQDPILLVIDNWEQVVEAAPVLSLLLAQCNGLWILATSRERLRLRGEWEVRVDPLAIPERPGDLQSIAASPAVRLFVERVSEAVDGFALDEANAPVVLEIVRRLDGIPLAIELMAARARLLPLEMLLERLEQRFQILTEGPRDLPVRLQTMQSAIAWSVDLLDEDERRLFARLSVFSGGFTIPAAAGVLAYLEPGSDPMQIEHTLLSLVDKSLVRPLDIDADEPRFAMYETIRDYASGRLDEQEDTERLLGAHAAHFLAMAEALESDLTGPDPRAAFELLEREIANVRAALGHLHARQDIEAALRLMNALAWFWTEPRLVAEGQHWFAALLAEPATASAPDVLQIRAQIAAGDLAFWQGDLDRSAGHHSRALDLLRGQGGERQLAAVLRSLANIALERSDYPRADALLTEARDQAMAAGNRWEVAASENLLGLSQTMQGAPDRAIERHRNAAVIWQDLGDRGHCFDALTGLAWAQLQAGRIAEAARSYLAALPLAIEFDDILQIEWCIRGAAIIAALGGRELERSVRLFSASEAIREEHGIVMRVRVGETIDQVMGDLQDRLGPDRFTRGWQTGQRLTRAQAIDEVRLVLEKTAV